MIFVSGLEPEPLHSLGTVGGVPELYGADILVVNKEIRIGVQRKKFPEDFLGSLADGRLHTQLQMLQELERSVVLLEGFGKWSVDGVLMAEKYFQNFTKKQLHGLMLSIEWEYDTRVMQVRDLGETRQWLIHLDEWSAKDRHDSLRVRPGPPRSAWGTRDNRSYALHVLQSFPGVGVELAGRIFDHFGGLPLSWDVEGYKDLMAVPGIGKEKAMKMWNALRKVDDGERKPENAKPVRTGRGRLGVNAGSKATVVGRASNARVQPKRSGKPNSGAARARREGAR